MAKPKLRKIVVDGGTYLWRFQPGYWQTGDPAQPYRCDDCFVAYLEGQPTSPLRIAFDTWECPVAGGPLRCGAPLHLGDAASAGINLGINLHTPRWAAVLIRAGLGQGWRPALRKSPCFIGQGIGLLESIAGFDGAGRRAL